MQVSRDDEGASSINMTRIRNLLASNSGVIYRQFSMLLRFAGALLLALIISAIAFLYLSTIDFTAEHGEAYGLNIGMPQQEVFDSLPKVLNLVGVEDLREPLVLQIYTAKGAVPNTVEFALNELDYSLLAGATRWTIYIDSNYFFDSFTLDFCEQELCRIKRYRQFLEFP
ncbi:hypothetical protein LG272_01130 [Pseudidiomarina marina]|uniref:hypothetical protein n=1 Tax=Pseudidiomarina marina TaxID=502366 RepID=UPI00384D868F